MNTRRRGNSGGDELRKWRERGKVPARSGADLVPCSERTWYRWERHQATPSLAHAFRLEEITDGAVPAQIWGFARAGEGQGSPPPRGGK
jgi:predicted transcriptional regulator